MTPDGGYIALICPACWRACYEPRVYYEWRQERYGTASCPYATPRHEYDIRGPHFHRPVSQTGICSPAQRIIRKIMREKLYA